MKRICIYVTLGLLGAVSAHAQEINIGQAVARKISDDKVEVSFNMDCSTLRLPSRRQIIITPLIISRSESDTLALPSVCIAGRNRYRMNKRTGPSGAGSGWTSTAWTLFFRTGTLLTQDIRIGSSYAKVSAGCFQEPI